MIKIIAENKIASLMINYVDNNKVSDEDFTQIIDSDPSPSKSFSSWILEQFVRDENIKILLPKLKTAIRAYLKYTEMFRDYAFKNKSISEFIQHVKSIVGAHLEKEQKSTLKVELAHFKVGTILNHVIYLIPKNTDNMGALLMGFNSVPDDIFTYGDTLYITSNSTRYLLSFAADIYVDKAGTIIPLKERKIELWDQILSRLYSQGIIKSDIVACIDMFGSEFEGSKLQQVIDSNNPEEVYQEYYSSNGNKLINLVVNANKRVIANYNKYIESSKLLGFDLAGTIITIDFSTDDIGRIGEVMTSEDYEGQVKSHFKRLGLSFDINTFQSILSLVDSKQSMNFILLKNTTKSPSILLQLDNVLGFINKAELNNFVNKFKTAKQIHGMIKQANEDTIDDYKSQLEDVKSSVETIIEHASSVKHYFLIQ